MANNYYQDRPEKIIRKRSASGVIFLGLGLAALAGLGLWYALAPQSVAQFHGQIMGKPLEIYSLVINTGPQTLSINPGGIVDIRPGQKFSLIGLNTNRWHNYGLTMVMVPATTNIANITGGLAASPLELLGEKDLSLGTTLRVEVKEGSKTQAIFSISSSFSALDLATRGDMAQDPQAKANYYRQAFSLDKNSELLQSKLAQALIDSGSEAEAIEIYETQLKKMGPKENILNRLLTLHTGLKNNSGRIKTLLDLISLKKEAQQSTSPLFEQLAQVYQEAGQLDQAAETYEQLANSPTKIEPEKLENYLLKLITLHHQLGNPPQEIKNLKRLAQISPPGESVALWSKIVALYDQSGDKEGQLVAWESLAGNLPPGPGQIDAYAMVGKLATELKHYAKAQQAYRQVLKETPDDLVINLNLARLAALADDRNEYREQLVRTIKFHPDNLALKKELAQALKEDKKNPQARDQYLEILKINPQDKATRLALMDLLKTMKNRPALTKQYLELLNMEPGNRTVAYNLGALYYDQKQWSKAAAVFKKLLKDDPKDSASRSYLLSTYQHLGRSKEVMQEALILFRQDPSQTVYRTLLLNTHENSKNWKKYTEVAEEATKLTPKDAQAWQVLARGHGQLRQKDAQAAALWKFAETMDKKNIKAKVRAWSQAGKTYASLKQNTKALEAYKEAEKLEPTNKRVGEAILNLKLKKAKSNKK